MSTDDLKAKYTRTVTMAGKIAYTLNEDREMELPLTGAWTIIKSRSWCHRGYAGCVRFLCFRTCLRSCFRFFYAFVALSSSPKARL